jgi:hypothetical protein
MVAPSVLVPSAGFIAFSPPVLRSLARVERHRSREPLLLRHMARELVVRRHETRRSARCRSGPGRASDPAAFSARAVRLGGLGWGLFHDHST